jgi:hypothetical protein
MGTSFKCINVESNLLKLTVAQERGIYEWSMAQGILLHGTYTSMEL